MKLLKQVIIAVFFFAGCFAVLQSQLMLSGCSTSPGYSTMSPGQSLYSAKCSSCHRLIEPQAHSSSEWKYYVDKYGKKLSSEDKRVMLEYLTEGGQQRSNNN